MKAFVLTISDRVSAGERADESGPLAADLLNRQGFSVDTGCVPDDADRIAGALREAVGSEVDLVVTTGGTGLNPRDVTPEATSRVIERPAPGIAEAIRAGGSVPTAVLSRGVAGVAGSTLVVNLAGSTGAVRDGIDVLAPLLGHVVAQLRGGDH